jgi:hypothetical protein
MRIKPGSMYCRKTKRSYKIRTNQGKIKRKIRMRYRIAKDILQRDRIRITKLKIRFRACDI